MNYRVKIPSYFTPFDFHFEPILDSAGHESNYRSMVERYRYIDKNNITYYQLHVNILRRHPEECVCTFKRNYLHTAAPLYIKQYGQEFILSSGDVQCITIYNVTKDELTDYVYGGDTAFSERRGFCPSFYEWGMLTNTLTIYGSVFDGPPEIMIIHNVDLNNLKFDNVEWKDYYHEGE